LHILKLRATRRHFREFGGSVSELGLVGGLVLVLLLLLLLVLVLVLLLENADVSQPERWNKITTGGSDSLLASSQQIEHDDEHEHDSPN